MPERPCPPSRPAEWAGPHLDLPKARASSSNTWATTWTAADGMGWPWVKLYGAASTSNDNKANNYGTFKNGFLYPNKDTTSSSTSALGESGHLFGRLG